MRLFAILLLTLFTASYANAELFQYNNPFPTQTSPQYLNNIYESEPEVMQKEVQQRKKSWWKIKDSVQEPQIETQNNFKTINEGIQNGNFYVFPNE